MLDEPAYMQHECGNWIIRDKTTNAILDVGSFESEDEALEVLAHLPIWEDGYVVVCDDWPDNEPPSEQNGIAF